MSIFDGKKDAAFWGRVAARQSKTVRRLNAERKQLVGALEEILKSDPCCCLDGDFHGDCQFCQARKVLTEQRKSARAKRVPAAMDGRTRKEHKWPPLVDSE